jgi:hypothetical protein
MSDQIAISGTLQTGPQDCSEGTGGFPSSASLLQLALLPCSKPYAVSTGPQLLNLNSPTTPAAIPGVGSQGPVVNAHTVYMRCASPMAVTFAFAGVGPTQTINLYGLLVFEVDPTHCVTGVAVQGTGQLEWLAVGSS